MGFKSHVGLTATAAVALSGGLLLAACGSSGTGHTAAPVAATTPTIAAATTAAPAGPTVGTKSDPKLGMILADSGGLTLYTLTNNGKPVDCTGACAAVWPPLKAPSGTPTGGSGVGALGVATLSDGTQVVTSGGLPLYRFTQDKDSGDAYGDGLTSFGGTWHVVKVGQASAAAPAAGGGSRY